MVRDERIESTKANIARTVFLIWYLLLTASLCYRTLVLRQPAKEFWDIFAIWVIGILFGFISFAVKGVFDVGFRRVIVPIVVIVLVAVPVTFLVAGQIHSASRFFAVFISGALGMGLFVLAAYLLTRLWRRRHGLDDEK